MIFTGRRPIATAPHSSGWPARMRRIRSFAAICCRTSICSCGVAFAHFDGRCSLRTWVYRVAHNVATGHVVRQRRLRKTLVSSEEVEAMPSNDWSELTAHQNQALDRLALLIQKLKPLDRQIIVLYLEEMDAASTAEITGLSAANVAMKVHRIKNILKRWFQEGEFHA